MFLTLQGEVSKIPAKRGIQAIREIYQWLPAERPAKLSGIVDMLRSAVRERNETVTVQVQERRDLRAAEKATLHKEDSSVEELRKEVAVLGSRMEQVLTLLKELLGTSKSGANALLQALLGMRIDLDGEAVGRLIAPEINERLNDLYELEERGRF